MTESEIVSTAIDNLWEITRIKADWKSTSRKRSDGVLRLWIGTPYLDVTAEVKVELRSHQIARIVEQAKSTEHYILIAHRLSPAIKMELREKEISYLESNGNIYFKQGGFLIHENTAKPVASVREKQNRAFSKTGLKVIFLFLLDENLINRPYRDIAANADVGLGNINYVITGLREGGYLLKIDQGKYQINNKNELLQKWVSAYGERLKPKLQMGSFRFLNEEDFSNWQKLKLDSPETVWGGEPAGALLTKYLRPQQLTIYTSGTKTELMRKYRLIPDENGNVKVFRKFWRYDETNYSIAPPVLVYADLLNTNDSRCREAGEIIYNEIIR